MVLNKILIRSSANFGKLSSVHMQILKNQFVKSVMRRYHIGVPNPRLFVNMDEKTVEFSFSLSKTVHHLGDQTISIRFGSSSQRLTVCVAVAYDGTKLAIFALLKGNPVITIERSLPSIMPSVMKY